LIAEGKAGEESGFYGKEWMSGTEESYALFNPLTPDRVTLAGARSKALEICSLTAKSYELIKRAPTPLD
jgi:hypothetical protein